NIIDPGNIRDDPHPPPVVFTELKIFNRRISPGDTLGGNQILNNPIISTERLELDHRDKIVTFSFAALNFTSPSNNRYAYRLEGLDEEWRQSGNHNQATFTSLQPGDYRMIVKAANADGVWNESGASMRISIAPPLWQAAPFRIALLAAVVLLLILIYRMRTGSIRRHNAELDSMNTRLEKQIEDRIKVEQALRESEQKYWSILDNLEIGISLVTPDMEMVELNSSMKEIFPEAGSGGLAVCRLIERDHGPDRFDSENPLDRTFNDGGVHESVCTLRREDSEANLRILVSPILASNQSVLAAIEMVEDITDRKKIEERLRNSQKMEAIGKLAGGIAHDFNNLLFAILGYSHLARKEIDPSSFAGEAIDQIETAGERASDLVKQILSFSRQAEVDKRAVSLDQPVREIITLLEGSLPSTVRIEYTIIEPAPFVFADTAQIHQVLMNLCTNAYQAMPDQAGTLEIIMEEYEVTDENRDEFVDIEDGRYVKLSVCDDGRGMTGDVMEKVFEPYFSTREDGKGSGLGLTIVHNIVKGMDGEISVSSEPGRGTEFEIFLPVIEGAVETELPGPGIEADLYGDAKVMVVDDERMISGMIEKYLAEHGYTVCAHSNSRKALEDFMNNPDEIDLVISDVTMPGLTGVELASRIRKKRNDIPIILITGYSERLDRKTEKTLRISRSLKKPISLLELARAVKDVFSEERDAS
ncbi:MAG: response regulator, partial [Candidatus Latescibacteria bacterium]|nr:response regulator [bacterium]MBD3424656.1 response regulator [Candidatus Latescibacterota bacterium]